MTAFGPPAAGAPKSLAAHLAVRGVSRRQFLTFCSEMCAILGLGDLARPRMAQALSRARRPSVVWLQLQECTGCVESVLRTAEPTIGDLLLDAVSLDYNHTLMAAAGEAAEIARHTAMRESAGRYLLVVTGSIPTAGSGVFCTIGGRTAREIVEEAADQAAAVIAVGACAHWGGVQAARPNPTGSVGVADVVRGKSIVNIAGCPPIGDVITATVVHFLSFGRLPSADADGRPLFAYGARIHDQCPRRANFDAGQFVEHFDDDAARRGWCLYKVGCKGPATFAPCPIVQWNTRTSWPIGAGHPCLGCTERNFWDSMTPFYGRLPENLVGLGVEKYADTIGAALAAGAVAGVGAHAAATGIHQLRQKKVVRELPVVDGPAPPAGDDHA